VTGRPSFGEFYDTIRAYSGHQKLFSEGKRYNSILPYVFMKWCLIQGWTNPRLPNYLGK